MNVRRFRFLLVMLVVCFVVLVALVVDQAEGSWAQAGARPPAYRTVVMSCAAAGYPAGWGSGCTVYRQAVARWRPARAVAR